METARNRFGGIDVLVNNAGGGLGGPVEGVLKSELQTLFDLNLFGVVAVTQAVLPLMRKQGSGVVVNVSLAAGRVGLPFLAPYCASKFALEGLTEAMVYEVAPFGIRMKLVEPGDVRTGFSHSWTESPAYRGASDNAQRRYAAGGKMAATADGVAHAIFRAATDGKSRLRHTANGAGTLLALNRMMPEANWRGLMRRSHMR